MTSFWRVLRSFCRSGKKITGGRLPKIFLNTLVPQICFCCAHESITRFSQCVSKASFLTMGLKHFWNQIWIFKLLQLPIQYYNSEIEHPILQRTLNMKKNPASWNQKPSLVLTKNSTDLFFFFFLNLSD